MELHSNSFFSFIYQQKTKIFFVVLFFVFMGFGRSVSAAANELTPCLKDSDCPSYLDANGHCYGAQFTDTVTPIYGFCGYNNIGGGFTIVQASPEACGSTNFGCNMKVAFGYVLFAFFSIGYFLSFLSKTLLIWVLTATNQPSLSFTHNPAVLIGWPIARNLANIIIVVELVIIAIATIVRYPQWFVEYEAKKLLGKLIIAALLINFSLVICGVVIDGSNITMSYLLGAHPENGTSQFSDTVYKPVSDFVGQIGPKTNWTTVIGVLLGNTFYAFMSAIVLFLYFFLFLFRIIALWILLIVSPIAFTCRVFPGRVQEIYTKWLSNSLQWCFIGVFGAFFLYIGEQLMVVTNNAIGEPVLTGSGITTTITGVTGAPDPLALIAAFVIPGLFLLIGFIFSLQLSAMGSNLALSGFKKARGYIERGAKATVKATGKWAADNTGATRAKNALQYYGTLAGERLRIVNRGTAAADWEAKNKDTLNEKGRVARTNALTDQELAHELSNPSSVLSTVQGQKDRAAMYSVLEKRGKLGMLSDADQMEGLRISQKYQNQEDTQRVVKSMSANNKRQIVNGVDAAGRPLRGYQQYEQTVRDAALGSLAEKGQINTITQADLTPALQRSLANGMDMENVVKALDKTHLEDLLTQGLFDPNTTDRLFDARTRNKIFKTIADKKLMSIMNDQQKLDALLESRTQQYQPKDALNSMESVDLARIINDDQNLISAGMAPIHDESTRTAAANSLLKRGDLDLVQEIHRENTVREMVDNGIDIEEIEKLDHNYAPFNRARINRLRAADPGQAPAVYANRASNEVLDRDFAKKDSDQLRNFAVGDITTKRIKQLTPEKLEAAYQFANQDVKDHLKINVQTELNDEAEDIYTRYLAVPPTQPAKAEQLYVAYQKLSKLITTIYDL